MASVPTGAVPPVNGLPAKTEDGEAKTTNGETAAVNWESEVQLVSSLAKLQELERRVSDVEHNNCFPEEGFSSCTHTSPMLTGPDSRAPPVYTSRPPRAPSTDL